MVTDRDELNKQLSATFANCGALGAQKASSFIASSGEDLINKLKGNGSYIFTLIHKFNKNDIAPIVPNHELLEAIARADLDDKQKEKLEQDFAKEYHLLTAQARLDIIAQDFVKHYSYLWETGKAMFVCLDKITCVRMYDLVQKYSRAQKVEFLCSAFSYICYIFL